MQEEGYWRDKADRKRAINLPTFKDMTDKLMADFSYEELLTKKVKDVIEIFDGDTESNSNKNRARAALRAAKNRLYDGSETAKRDTKKYVDEITRKKKETLNARH